MNTPPANLPVVQFSPIGIIRTPFEDIANMPIQPKGARGIQGTIEVFEPYREGLADLDGFSHVILLFHLHRVKQSKLKVIPFLDTVPRGIFATRSPSRPNPIGLSIVELVKISGGNLLVDGVDMLNGTPLLDLKPYVPEFDHQPTIRTGWFEKARGKVETKRSDDRFR